MALSGWRRVFGIADQGVLWVAPCHGDCQGVLWVAGVIDCWAGVVGWRGHWIADQRSCGWRLSLGLLTRGPLGGAVSWGLLGRARLGRRVIGIGDRASLGG